MLAIAVLTPLRAFAQTPAPEAAPPAAAPPAPPPAAPPPVEAAPPAAAPMAPPAAAPAPAAPAAPAPKITWGGLVDTYYMYLFNPADGANSLSPPSAATVNRAFDTNSNSMTLAYAKLSMNASIDPVAFQLDFGYGTTGTIINAGNTGFALPAGVVGVTAAPFTGSFIIQQAYGTISLPGNLTLDFGKFVTTAGAEVIEANKNWLYSRSLLFNIIPFLHTGARANLKVNDQLTLQASLVNGWNNDPDNNAFKTIGVSASITVSPMVSIIATGYFGKEATQPAVGSTPGDWTILADLVAAFTINDKFGVNVNFDYINAPTLTSNSSDHQVGVAAMARYVISDHANVAARGEFLQNHFAGINVNQEEFTLMLGLPVGKNFELRPEFRGDFSGDNIFAFGTKKNEFTGTLAALTYF
jgi:hypothetical protein